MDNNENKIKFDPETGAPIQQDAPQTDYTAPQTDYTAPQTVYTAPQQNTQGAYNTYNNTVYQPPVKDKSQSQAFGITALVLGLISLLCCWLFFPVFLAPVAIIFAIIQLAMHRPKGMAIAGMVCAIIAILIYVVGFAFVKVEMNNPEFREQFEQEFKDQYPEYYQQYLDNLDEL